MLPGLGSIVKEIAIDAAAKLVLNTLWMDA